MKYAVFGLGNFGRVLALELTRMGHEVVAVDERSERVEEIKDEVSYAIQLNSTDEKAVRTLPLNDLDAAIVAIGEDEGASIMTTALLRQLKVERIISRAFSSLHQTVLESMGVEEIVHPEGEAASRLAMRLNLKNTLDTYDLPSGYLIAEVNVPAKLVGKTIGEVAIRTEYEVSVITLLREESARNLFGFKRQIRHAVGPVDGDTELKEGDVMVIFGSEDNVNGFAEGDE